MTPVAAHLHKHMGALITGARGAGQRTMEQRDRGTAGAAERDGGDTQLC